MKRLTVLAALALFACGGSTTAGSDADADSDVDVDTDVDTPCRDYCAALEECDGFGLAECLASCAARGEAETEAGIDADAVTECMTEGAGCSVAGEDLDLLRWSCSAAACGWSGSCSDGDYDCYGDARISCYSGGVWVAVPCVEACATRGEKTEYAGVCGERYDGQKMPFPVCWCVVPE